MSHLVIANSLLIFSATVISGLMLLYIKTLSVPDITLHLVYSAVYSPSTILIECPKSECVNVSTTWCPRFHNGTIKVVFMACTVLNAKNPTMQCSALQMLLSDSTAVTKWWWLVSVWNVNLLLIISVYYMGSSEWGSDSGHSQRFQWVPHSEVCIFYIWSVLTTGRYHKWNQYWERKSWISASLLGRKMSFHSFLAINSLVCKFLDNNKLHY